MTNPVLETVAALLTPYVAYLLGEVLHVSGVTAVIVAGLFIGSKRAEITTAQTRLQVHSVYQIVIFVLESVVFSLIGLELPTLVRSLSHTSGWLVAALAVSGTLIAVRAAWVFVMSAISGRRGGTRPAWPAAAVGEGGHPRRGAAGRRLVDPRDDGERRPVAAAGFRPGADRRHDRGLAARAGLHPGAAGPARRVRPGRASGSPPRGDHRPAAGWPRPGWPAWTNWPRTTPPPTP